SMGAGYDDVHFSNAIFSFPILWHASIAKSISSVVAIPVEIIIGFPFEATYSINGMSVISKEAILYAGTFNSSKKSTAVLSNGDEKQMSPSSVAISKSFLCHSHGV